MKVMLCSTWLFQVMRAVLKDPAVRSVNGMNVSTLGVAAGMGWTGKGRDGTRRCCNGTAFRKFVAGLDLYGSRYALYFTPSKSNERLSFLHLGNSHNLGSRIHNASKHDASSRINRN